MALIDVSKLSDAGGGFGELPVVRQVIVLIVLSASIALGVFVALWAKSPNLVPLYTQIDPKEMSTITDSLDKHGIIYQYSPSQSGILVPSNDVYKIRMKLAGEGLPNSTVAGYELLDKPRSFGTTQFMEDVKYRRSIEGELSKTISSLDAVRGARVHLGMTRESSFITFIKKDQASTASVMLDLYPGQHLVPAQVAGISHLIASSVSGLKEENVSIVDQRGNLLTISDKNGVISAVAQELNYTKQKEKEYTRKILDVLTPIYGMHSVKAEVTADMDFTTIEKTKESFDSDRPIVKQEYLVTEQKGSDLIPEGIPGALTNQPPSLAEAPEQLENQNADNEEGTKPELNENKKQINFRDQANRNYEVDKTITHERQSIGKINKISVAVVIDDKTTYNPAGVATKTPLTEDEIANADRLVKDVIGFDADRGDKLSIVNSTFAQTPPVPAAMPLKIFEQAWFFPVVKQSLGGLFILIIVFTVLRPMLKSLTIMAGKREKDIEEQVEETAQPKPTQIELPEPDLTSKARVEHVKKIAHEDSKRAAQVVMNWVGQEDE